MRTLWILSAGCLALWVALMAPAAQALERVAATPYGGAGAGSALSLHVPTCAAGEVITGRDGRLVCTTAEDLQPTCGLAVRMMTCTGIQNTGGGGDNISTALNGFSWVSVFPCKGNDIARNPGSVGAIPNCLSDNAPISCPSGYTARYGANVAIQTESGGGAVPAPLAAWCVKN